MGREDRETRKMLKIVVCHVSDNYWCHCSYSRSCRYCLNFGVTFAASTLIGLYVVSMYIGTLGQFMGKSI